MYLFEPLKDISYLYTQYLVFIGKRIHYIRKEISSVVFILKKSSKIVQLDSQCGS